MRQHCQSQAGWERSLSLSAAAAVTLSRAPSCQCRPHWQPECGVEATQPRGKVRYGQPLFRWQAGQTFKLRHGSMPVPTVSDWLRLAWQPGKRNSGIGSSSVTLMPPLASPAWAATPRSARVSPLFSPRARRTPRACSGIRNVMGTGRAAPSLPPHRPCSSMRAVRTCWHPALELRFCRRAVQIGQLRMSRSNVHRITAVLS